MAPRSAFIVGSAKTIRRIRRRMMRRGTRRTFTVRLPLPRDIAGQPVAARSSAAGIYSRRNSAVCVRERNEVRECARAGFSRPHDVTVNSYKSPDSRATERSGVEAARSLDSPAPRNLTVGNSLLRYALVTSPRHRTGSPRARESRER